MIIPANTALILNALRLLLLQNNLDAYIVPSGDSHYTEFVAECHQRRGYISGFTGSSGTAVITANEALVWTDGRYYLQAVEELDNTIWTLMKDGMLGTASISQWLHQNLTEGARVGVDPTLYSKGQWDNLQVELVSGNKTLVAIAENLVDSVWAVDGTKPNCSNNPILSLELEFSGKNTSVKVADIRDEMDANNAETLVITELDEVAWLLNLRGKDIPSSSTFFGYVILTKTSLDFFVNLEQINATVQTTLEENVPEISILNYGDVFEHLKNLSETTSGKVWFNRNANYLLVQNVPSDRQLLKLTPIALMKAIKNEVEVAGYRKALIRDAAALCEFFAWLEVEMESGQNITEISASNKLIEIRAKREHFEGVSFTAISATGSNGAIIHYMPTEKSDTQIAKDELYLLDSGALYKDGTTDITRTLHFGTPSAIEKDRYTRVLKGQIAVTTATFPEKTVGHRLDSFARQALWAVGLDYNHGTGHGIGSYLNVHEGPFSIGSGYSANDPGLQANMFTSNEPGYYEDNQFGIRLENIIRVTNVTLENNFQDRGFLGFEDLTFVPYQHKLIDFSLLSEKEIAYLNDYQITLRTRVGEYIQDPSNNVPAAAFDWMTKETEPIIREEITTTTTPSSPQSSTPDSSAQLTISNFWVSNVIALTITLSALYSA